MTKFGVVDFNIWNDTYDPDFIDINIKSNVRHSWLSFDRVLSGKYSKSLIKPINKYAETLYLKPVLIKNTSEEIILQQINHAEIAIGYNNGILHTVDKPHIRQYYNTLEEQDVPDFCFPKVFKLYVPWIIDEDIDVSFESADDSPFFIYDQIYSFKKTNDSLIYYRPPFISFSFKNTGSHIIRDNSYAKILIGSPMFNIRIKSNKELSRKIKDFYEKEK